MKMTMALIATVLSALSMITAGVPVPTAKKGSTLIIAGYPGEAQLVEINGKSYVDLQTLALITKGTLSFKPNQTILTLRPPVAEAPPPPPPPKPGLSRAFTQAGIEELSVIREWRTQIVNAVQTNTPIDGDSIAARHRLAEKNLSLAAAAVSTDDDRSAYPLLVAELNNMQKLSDAYFTLRSQAAFISPESFGNSALEEQILSCAQGFTSMTESHEFQDQAACR